MRTAFAIFALLTACSGDEREPVGGTQSPNAEHCVKLGGSYIASAEPMCLFSDGTSCDVNDFLDGTCGQSHSYCAAHGGTLSGGDVDAGTDATCTTKSGTCSEATYFFEHTCK